MSKNVAHECCTSGRPEQCNSGKFKRVNYFHGMLLTEEDFVDEQTYLREKLKLHNRFHGAGVMWGLELKKDCIKVPSKEAGGGERKITKLFICGGVALDCAGNEIVVCESFLIPLDEKIEELRRYGLLQELTECEPKTYKGPRLYVGVRHCECRSQPAEQYTSECADDRLRPQFSRVREGFVVQLFTAEELSGCRKPHKGGECNCPECRGLYPCRPDEQVIILGYVENYDTGSNENPDHKDAKIGPYENYPTSPAGLGESMWAYPRWEAQKQNVLRSILDNWIDVSVIIGRGEDDAKDWLKEKGLNPGTIYKTGDIQSDPQKKEFFERARNAERWAAPGATVDLVATGSSDKSGEPTGKGCIAFLFVKQ